MFKRDSDTEYLLGSKQPNTLPTKPFDSLVCEFLEIFSKKLNSERKRKKNGGTEALNFS